MTRPLPAPASALALLLLLTACTDRDAPRPVPVPDQGPAPDRQPLSSREAAPAGAPVDPEDPAEPGISDLARLARYVFKTMQRHEAVCPFANPFRDRLHFAFDVEVRAGRMTRAGLAHAGVEPGTAGEGRSLAREQWPRELTAYVSCLEPHLKAVVMAPSPADGAYEPVYSFGGQPSGRPAP
jgi:hypothetical protein